MKHFLLSLTLLSVMQLHAELIDFESPRGYVAIDVYDCWEASPFRLGTLSGNVAVTPNIDPHINDILQIAPNDSPTVIGAQRSRYGSNTFGLRIDLESPFELTPEPQYVHVMLHKPCEGRVMLVGLGSRRELTSQNPYVEQFWEMSSNTVDPGRWTDAVFAIKGAGGIDVRSLVIIPDCESPHNLTDDFLFYVDNIEINNNPISKTIYDYYPISNNKSISTLSRTDRFTTGISINGDANGFQSTEVFQQSNRKLYHNLTLSDPLNAQSGENITPAVQFIGSWMHSYCYVDFNRNGRFDDSELVSYSYLDGKDSDGNLRSANNALAMPSFTIPADTPAGLYRMRIKVDWNNSDPAGAIGENSIINNGGIIVDIMLNIHDSTAIVNDFQLNGEILAANGAKLNSYPIPALKPLTITANPENGFTYNGATLKHGYSTSEESQLDKYGNPNWFLHELGPDELIIPAKHIWGNILLNGKMVEVQTVSD